MSEVKITLVQPITAHGAEVTEISLRKPTAADARAVGVLPYRLNGSDIPDINISAACQYISKCSGIPPSSVDQLDPFDLNTACWAVAGFFLSPGSQTSSS